MDAKPRAWSPGYARWFELCSVVDRYDMRPPYPAETFEIVTSLVDPANAMVLDAGCGLGDLARPLARRVAGVDAVDRSEAMLARGRTLAGGDATNLRWVLGDVEDAPLAEEYGLVICGDSVHWFDWPVALPRFRRCLSSRGQLALVERRWRLGAVNPERLGDLYARHSANTHFAPLNPVTELQRRGLFDLSGQYTTAAVPWRPTLIEVIACHHSQNGFAVEKMADPTAFDRELTDELRRSLVLGDDGRYDLTVDATISWGRPKLTPF